MTEAAIKERIVKAAMKRDAQTSNGRRLDEADQALDRWCRALRALQAKKTKKAKRP